ncbi:MAG: hypothetical protein ACOC6F_04220 [bacterium]
MRFARYWLLIPITLTIVVSGTYLILGLTAADGRPVAPLDDAYITFQYARQIAEGQPYQYNDGDPPTTGMTSPLFGFLLAGAYRLGFTGESLPGLAVGLGVIWLSLSAWFTHRTSFTLTESRPWSSLAASLVVLTGSVQWGCFNGMETGFFTVLTLAALNAFLTDHVRWSAFWLALAALTRTEGMILAVLIWSVTAVAPLLRDGAFDWQRLVPLSGAVLISLTPFLINLTLTGTPSAAGLSAKSWLLNVPFYPLEIARSILITYRRIILGRFIFGNHWFVAPATLVLSALGWVALGIRGRWMTLWTTMSWFLVGTLSTATLITATWHMGRYQVPFVPVVIILATHSVKSLSSWAGRGRRLILAGTTALYLLLSCSYSAFYSAKQYCLAVSTTARQQLTIADWLRENTPLDTRVGVHDTGSLRYVGKRPTYDLVGLTTPDAGIAWRHGSGSVFEKMEHSPMRPSHFATYPDVFSIPYLAATDLFADELFRVEVPNYVIASAGPVQSVWRADWRLAGSGEDFYQSDILQRTTGLEVVDTLDVANLDDEAAHAVDWWQDARRSGFPTEVWQLAYRVPSQREALDGGRLLTGGMAFDVNTEANRPLWIVARLHAQQAGAVQVEVDGRRVGRWTYPAIPGEWLETLFHVPADHVASPQTRVKLTADADNPEFQHYAPYYFWLLQGKAEDASVDVDHTVDAAFAGDIWLIGFDIPKEHWNRGDTIPVTLYWTARHPTQSDAKVFLHLYGPDGSLGPQSDGWAFHGTRPPYTWAQDEIVADPRNLAVTHDLSPGEYSLEIGLYSPDEMKRLPAYSEGSPVPEDRIMLTTINIAD